MGPDEPSQITQLLNRLKTGDRSQFDQLFAGVYQELRNLGRTVLRARSRKETPYNRPHWSTKPT